MQDYEFDEYEPPEELHEESSPLAFHTLSNVSAMGGRTLPSPRTRHWTARGPQVSDDDLHRALRQLCAKTVDVGGTPYYTIETVNSILSCYEAIVISWKAKALQRAKLLCESKSVLSMTRDLLNNTMGQVAEMQKAMSTITAESVALFRSTAQRIAFEEVSAPPVHYGGILASSFHRESSRARGESLKVPPSSNAAEWMLRGKGSGCATPGGGAKASSVSIPSGGGEGNCGLYAYCPYMLGGVKGSITPTHPQPRCHSLSRPMTGRRPPGPK